jgi:septum formation protein
MRIILGSSSVRRAEILRTIIPAFDVIAPDIDEKVFQQPSASARTSAVAMAKGRAIRDRVKEPSIILTADTVVQMEDGSIREKPVNEQEARSWLCSYATLRPQCVTALYALRTSDGRDVLAVDAATIVFRRFTQDRIDAIIEDGTAMGCAGAFTMEHPLFRNHVEGVSGNPETIQGLPGPFVRLHLKTLGYRG